MIRPGEVSAIRELSSKGNHRVQAQVCIGSDVEKGTAVVTVEVRTPEVLAALADLKAAIAKHTKDLLGGILEGQRQWDAQMEKTEKEKTA